MKNPTYYICKYTPVELLTALGGDCILLDEMPENFDRADQVSHPNLCGFGKSVIQSVLSGNIRELVLVNCCDSIRASYDALKEYGNLDFLYMMDLLHHSSGCSVEHTTGELKKLAKAYADYRGTTFDPKAFLAAFSPTQPTTTPHLQVMGARMGGALFQMVESSMPLPVVNATCSANRSVDPPASEEDFDALMLQYARLLLDQMPCMRMRDIHSRRALCQSPGLEGVIYHTVKFCDYYGFEYADLKDHLPVPLLKLESDYTLQSREQLRTRLEAFAETFLSTEQEEHTMKHGYFAGIDSGSATTDVVILDDNRTIISRVILPTGAGASDGAERALRQALEQAGLSQGDLACTVTTGYGRSAITAGDKSITEITCHAKGAHFLNPDVGTILDIGGQDSKVIRLDEHGGVATFVMNDKCAAGTGRFLEMMARTLELPLEEMSTIGLQWKEEITISSMCTVFADSEVVSLVARNKAVPDIVHGLNHSVAAKAVSLYHRAGGGGLCMMTGGVSRNAGVVQAIQERLGQSLYISEDSQLCGALGAALFASEL